MIKDQLYDFFIFAIYFFILEIIWTVENIW